MDESMRLRAELMQAQLDAEQSKRQISIFQEELNSQSIRAKSSTDRAKGFEEQLVVSEAALAEYRVRYQSAQEEIKIYREKSAVVNQENIAHSKRIKELDQQVYSLGLDKVCSLY